MTAWTAAEDAEFARFAAISADHSVRRPQPALQKLSNRSRPARQPVLEAERIDGVKLFGRQHDLKSLVSRICGHELSPELATYSFNAKYRLWFL
jgi:hypothetical protein